MAKKIMFEQQKEEPAGAGSRKNNRRETWCPGRSNWAPMPAGMAAAPSAQLMRIMNTAQFKSLQLLCCSLCHKLCLEQCMNASLVL
jgi:hypothetical protein